MSIRSRAKHRIRRKKLGRPFCGSGPASPWPAPATGMLTGAVPAPRRRPSNPHPLAVSSVVAADSLPWLLLALPAGRVRRPVPRGPLMAITNVLRAAAIAVGAFLILRGHMTLAMLIVVVLINASGRAIYYSSLQAVVPDSCRPTRSEYGNGVLIATEAATETLAGPIVGTWLFAMNKAIPFFADAVVVGAVLHPPRRLPLEGPHIRGCLDASVWEGVRFLWDDRRLRFLILMVASLAGLQGMESGVLVLLATTEWGVGTGAYGLFLAVGAAGSLLGSLCGEPAGQAVQERPDPDRRRRRLRRRLPDHGGRAGMATGRPRLRSRRLRRRRGAVVAIALRQRLTPPEADGPGRRRLPGHRLGRRPGRRPARREPRRPRRPPVAPGPGRGAAVRRGGGSWPVPSSAASRSDARRDCRPHSSHIAAAPSNLPGQDAQNGPRERRCAARLPRPGSPPARCRHAAISSLEQIPPISGGVRGWPWTSVRAATKSVDSMDTTKRSKTGTSAPGGCLLLADAIPDDRATPAEATRSRGASPPPSTPIRLSSACSAAGLCLIGPLQRLGRHTSHHSPGRHVRHDRRALYVLADSVAGGAALPWQHHASSC